MASATAPTTLALLKTTAASSSASRTSASLLRVPSTRVQNPVSLRHSIGFAFSVGDSVLSRTVSSSVRSVSGKGSRGVVSMAKKSVGDLTAADLKGKKVFVRTFPWMRTRTSLMIPGFVLPIQPSSI
ncbi:hypothetical protein SLEP1_g56474 [Rubroshorea leprosula]|uniref:Uncharacterized protein n=1 Tax=Rubroshorea leprosula TaxID=152421 RepID=A0AAV5MJT2_9ROSI|nr:hypothetical protein SLEP1_g56474 [Rubroshorea leprosula]